MHAIAHGGHTDTVRECALKVDSRRKIPCRTGESNLHRRRAGPILYQLSYIPTPEALSRHILQGILKGGRRRGRQRQCGMDNVKEWASLSVTEIITVASHRKKLEEDRCWITRGGNFTFHVWHKSTKLAHSFYSVLVYISVFMALSTVFHSINSPDNYPLSHSVLRVLSLPYWSFQLYVSLWKSLSALM